MTEKDGVKLAEEVRQRRSRTALTFYIYFTGLDNMGQTLAFQIAFFP